MQRPKLLDFILISLVLLAAFTGFVLTLPGDLGSSAVILVDGKEIASFPLDGPIQEFEIGTCRFRIGNGTAQFLSSDCPDQICVHTGILTHAGQAAACVPQRTLLEIRGKSDIDIITG